MWKGVFYKWSCRDADALVQRSCASGPTGSCCRHPDREILHKRFAYRDLAQVALLRKSWRRHLAQEILIHRSCASSSTGFCWGYLKHLAQEIPIQRSCTRVRTGSWCRRPCTSGPTESWCRHHGRETLHKRSSSVDRPSQTWHGPSVVRCPSHRRATQNLCLSLFLLTFLCLFLWVSILIWYYFF